MGTGPEYSAATRAHPKFTLYPEYIIGNEWPHFLRCDFSQGFVAAKADGEYIFRFMFEVQLFEYLDDLVLHPVLFHKKDEPGVLSSKNVLASR